MNLIDFFGKIYKSLELSDNGKNSEDFISIAEKAGINAFDKSKVDDYRENPYFIEEEIERLILNNCAVDIKIKYTTFFTKTMNACSQFHVENQSSIIVDELLIHSFLTFFIIVASVSCNSDLIDDGCQLLHLLFANQIRKKEIDVTLTQRTAKLLLRIPSEAISNIMDYFWCAYTFLIGHEIYHITAENGNDEFREELEADSFGYTNLIRLILMQKSEMLNQSFVNVYYERNYLSPVFLFEYYKWEAFYRQLWSIECTENTSHPSPEIRSDSIIEMFEHLPDDFDTKDGNAILSSLLNASDEMKSRIIFLGLI